MTRRGRLIHARGVAFDEPFGHQDETESLGPFRYETDSDLTPFGFDVHPEVSKRTRHAMPVRTKKIVSEWFG